MNSMLRSTRAWLPVTVLVVVIDQLTKAWAVNELVDRNIELLWTLQFNLSFNTGMAFGQGQDLGPVIAVVAMVVVVVVLLRMRPAGGRLANIAIGLIIGGAIGNIMDRLFRGRGWLRGGVVDFIDFQWFPIFNVADMGITIGGGILVLASWLASRELAEQHSGANDVDDEPTSDPSFDPSSDHVGATGDMASSGDLTASDSASSDPS